MNISQNLKRVTVWSCNPTTREHTSGKTVIQEDTCTSMFIATLLTIAKTWKQPKSPLTEEWINKMWYICTMEYYLAVKTNELCSHIYIPARIYILYNISIFWLASIFSFRVSLSEAHARLNLRNKVLKQKKKKNEWNNTIQRKMDESSNYHTKWNKPDKYNISLICRMWKKRYK